MKFKTNLLNGSLIILLLSLLSGCISFQCQSVSDNSRVLLTDLTQPISGRAYLSSDGSSCANQGV